MKFNKWVRSTLVALLLVAPASQATLVGYDVTFSGITPPEFFSVSFADGMIYVDDSVLSGANVDQWMFDVSFTFLTFSGSSSGASSFAGSNCLTSSCSSTAGLIFNPVAMTLLGDISSPDGAKIAFAPAGAIFTFPPPVNPAGTPTPLTTTADVTITAKSVPEPTTVFLMALGLMFISAYRKHAQNRA